MEAIQEIEKLVSQAKLEADKAYVKNNKASITRLRGLMQEIKNQAQLVRVDSLKYQKDLPTKKRAGKKGGDEPEEEEEETKEGAEEQKEVKKSASKKVEKK